MSFLKCLLSQAISSASTSGQHGVGGWEVGGWVGEWVGGWVGAGTRARYLLCGVVPRPNVWEAECG